MYLYKNRNSIYYGRICSPKRLVALGFPFDVKFSLKPKGEILRFVAVTPS
ncbi:hypothetical protein [Vibrio sp. PNB22_1_1]